ncbi:hypothetical protein V501_00880 [Pseudogymnoascus sp. VKM F-4519 (FW-2642)]|nr:hypothetical protein V501_00880 [Pseudogymnoascus sp. VKM F-4519 (FW-2642)]
MSYFRKVHDAAGYSVFFHDNKPSSEAAAEALAAGVAQWKLVKFEETPAGCPIPQKGNYGIQSLALDRFVRTWFRKALPLIDSGNTVYDADGNLITMDGRVMRGNELWFNRIFNGADDPDPLKGASFAQDWLTKYVSYVKDNDGLDTNVRRVDRAKRDLYERYYSAELDRRRLSVKIRLRFGNKRKPTPDLNPTPNSNSTPKRKLVKLKLPSEKLMLFPNATTGAKMTGTAASKKPPREKYSESGQVELALTKTGLEAEKASKKLKNSAPASPKNIAPAPVETPTETVTKLRREIAGIQRMAAGAEGKAVAEENAVSEKAAVKKADAEKVAAKLAGANAESNRKTADRTLKCVSESIKHAISGYLAQRKAEAADKTLVGKLDEELAPYFQDALNVTASKTQKRKIRQEEIDDERPAKIAKK